MKHVDLTFVQLLLDQRYVGIVRERGSIKEPAVPLTANYCMTREGQRKARDTSLGPEGQMNQ